MRGHNSDFFRKRWDKKIEGADLARAEGKVTITIVSSRVQVSSPFLAEFAKDARALDGKWRDRTKIWSFSIRSYNLVVSLCKHHFGADNVIVNE